MTIDFAFPLSHVDRNDEIKMVAKYASLYTTFRRLFENEQDWRIFAIMIDMAGLCVCICMMPPQKYTKTNTNESVLDCVTLDTVVENIIQLSNTK